MTKQKETDRRVTKEEYLHAARWHIDNCPSCIRRNYCGHGQMMLDEIKRQGWDLMDAPDTKP